MSPVDRGALRLARAQPDVLLCEELKQLYTALTRAKNNVIMFDSNMAKRAPFFNYLRRLGMAQYVSRSDASNQHALQHAYQCMSTVPVNEPVCPCALLCPDSSQCWSRLLELGP